MSFTSSGSVPSTTSEMPFLMKASSTFSASSSRASRPSRRAFSAMPEMVRMTSALSMALPLYVIETIVSLAIVMTHLTPLEAMSTPFVPPKTIIIAVGCMNATGLPPSRIMAMKSEAMATPMPIPVAGSTVR